MKDAKVASVRFLPRNGGRETKAPPPPVRAKASGRRRSILSQAVLGLVMLSMLTSMLV